MFLCKLYNVLKKDLNTFPILGLEEDNEVCLQFFSSKIKMTLLGAHTHSRLNVGYKGIKKIIIKLRQVKGLNKPGKQ